MCCWGTVHAGGGGVKVGSWVTSGHQARCRSILRVDAQIGKALDNFDSIEADGDDLADAAEDVLRVFGAAGVVDEAAAGICFDAELVNPPRQRRPVVEHFAGNAFCFWHAGGDAAKWLLSKTGKRLRPPLVNYEKTRSQVKHNGKKTRTIIGV